MVFPSVKLLYGCLKWLLKGLCGNVKKKIVMLSCHLGQDYKVGRSSTHPSPLTPWVPTTLALYQNDHFKKSQQHKPSLLCSDLHYLFCLNSQPSLLGFHASAILIYFTDFSMCHTFSSPAELYSSCSLCLGSLSSPFTIFCLINPTHPSASA